MRKFSFFSGILDNKNFIDNSRNSRANQGVLRREVHDLIHIFTVGVRVFSAGQWTVVIYRTGVVVKEIEARRSLKDVIIIFVNSEVARNQLTLLHFEGLGHSSNIGLSKNRASGFAAIGAAEAIFLGKFFLMGLMKTSIEVFGFLLVPFAKLNLIALEICFGVFQYCLIFLAECCHM